MKRKIKLLKAYDGHKAGEVIEVSPEEAKSFIAMGIAEKCVKLVKLLKEFDGKKIGEELEFENEAEAKGLVDNGYAEYIEDDADDSVIEDFIQKKIDEGIEKVFAKMAKKSKSGLRVDDVHENYQDDPGGACKSIGVFAKEVNTFHNTKVISDNLKMAVMGGQGSKAVTLTDSNNESIGADGGFLIPDAMSARILESSMVNSELNMLERVNSSVIGGNNMTFPELDNTDQSVAATRHGGIITFWGNEAAEKTKSKLKFKENNYRLHKLFALVPVTDELLEDTIALESRINTKTGAAMIDTVNQAIIAGDGTGKPQGIIGSTRTVESPTDANRTTAAPITVAGLTGMFDRLLGGINPSWLINQELRSAISRLKIGDIPVMSGGNLQGVPFNFILGMPVSWTDICKAPATIGDIILSNFAGYEAITKGGVKSAVSIHLYFDQDITAFRFVFRIDGKPAISQPTKPLNGVNDLSDFVTLKTTV